MGTVNILNMCYEDLGPEYQICTQCIYHKGGLCMGGFSTEYVKTLGCFTGEGRITKVDRAAVWLVQVLLCGPRAVTTIMEMAKLEGYGETLMRRAKKAAKIKSKRTGPFKNGEWIWLL